MQKIALLGSAMLLLGLVAQAHAGEYVLNNNVTWTAISASSAAVTNDEPHTRKESPSEFKQTTRRWDWQPNNGDAPTPVKITLTFSGSTGACEVGDLDPFDNGSTYGDSTITGSFANAGYNWQYRTGNSNSAYDEEPMIPAVTGNYMVSKLYGGASNITETAETSSSVGARVWIQGFASAGAANISLTAFEIGPQ